MTADQERHQLNQVDQVLALLDEIDRTLAEVRALAHNMKERVGNE